MRDRKAYILLFLLSTLLSCERDEPGSLELQRVFVGSAEINRAGPISDNLPIDRSITLAFSSSLKKNTTDNLVSLWNGENVVGATLSFSGNSIILFPDGLLLPNTIYTLKLSNQIQGVNGERFEAIEIDFKTALQN